MTPFSVILKEDVPLDPRTYGAHLAPMLGVTLVEAKMAVRRGGGIVAENLPEEEAKDLAGMLAGDGIECWCIPSDALPIPRAPRRVTSFEAGPDGLRCALQDQREPQLLAWDRIGVVSVGLVLVPELQSEIAGVRKKDAAAVARREQEERDLVRDRMIETLTRVDLSHEENAPAAGQHHYFFDQLRRREAMQMKAFADVITEDGSDWWRLALEESSFRDRSGEAAEPGIAGANYLAVPVLYAQRKGAHTERSRKLLQGGNVERLAFPTMEDFNRYTRWWSWKTRLEAEPGLAPMLAAAPSGNGQARVPSVERPPAEDVPESRPGFPWRSSILLAVLALLVAAGMGVRFERRGAKCLLCLRNRQDDVIRFWGKPVRERLGEWQHLGAGSPYDQIVGKEHEHLYMGFGYDRSGLFGMAWSMGKDPGGNATAEDFDAAECVNGLLAWVPEKEATPDEIKAAYPRLFERVRSTRDPAERRKWVDLAQAKPDRTAPRNLLSEINP